MVTMTTKETTQEELDAHKKAGDEEKRKSERVEIKLVTKPAVTMLEGQLTTDMLTELNNYIDENRADAKDYSSTLVGQIKQGDMSEQLSLDMEAPPVKGLINVLAECGRQFLASYSQDVGIQLEGDDGSFLKAPIDCHSIWTVHSYA